MKTLITKVTSAISGAIVFAAACVMAGLGLAVVATLMILGVFAMGIALLAAPFVGYAVAANDDEATSEVAT